MARALYVTLFAAAVVTGCEQGIVVDVEVVVPADIANEYSPMAPGRLVVAMDIGGSSVPTYDLGFVCGGAMSELVAGVVHDGFGCAQRGVVRAWIAEADPADAVTDCALREGQQLVTAAPLEATSPQAEVPVFADNPRSGCRTDEDTVRLIISRPM